MNYHITNGADVISSAKDLKIVNLCPHDINIYAGAVFDELSGKLIGGVRVAHFPRSGKLASAINKIYSPIMVELQPGGVAIPMVRREIAEVTDLPAEPEDNTMYIVSSVYADGARKLGKKYIGRLFTPHGQVFSTATGKQIGCTGLIRYTDSLSEDLFPKTDAIAG